MTPSQIFITAVIVVLFFVLVFFGRKNPKTKRLTILTSIAFAFIVAGIVWLLLAIGIGASGALQLLKPPAPQFIIIGLVIGFLIKRVHVGLLIGVGLGLLAGGLLSNRK